MIAALYIDPRGPYPTMQGVECWDETRNAKGYAGPHPVVAHPPCGPWGRLSRMSRRQDPACAYHAVADVRRWGGVLEHPEGSRLWADVGLPPPGERDAHGFTIVVDQCDWGHVARKRTWLYCVGVDPNLAAQRPAPRNPTHWVCGGRNRSKKTGGIRPADVKVCSAQQRRRTPPLFAAWLVSLAESVRRR